MKRYAIYRVLYGEDFIQESIMSIQKYVDKIFIFWTAKPFGSVKKVNYKGQEILLPKKFDNVLEKIKSLYLSHVIMINAHYDHNMNQFTDIVNKRILPYYEMPDTIIIIESDMVFRDDQAQKSIQEFESCEKDHASTRMIEFWKTPYYRCPGNIRAGHMGVMFWDIRKLGKMPRTRRHANINGTPHRLNAFVHNFGLCFSEKNMYWKHLASLAYSQFLGDSLPNEMWYENIWLNWDYEKYNKNLEISQGYSHLIPFAEPYNVRELPESIKKKYNIKT